MALTKLQSNGLAVGAITVSSIEANAITLAKIATNAVDTGQLVNNAVTTSKLSSVIGSGDVVLATSPTIITPNIGTPSFAVLTNATVDGTDSVGFRNVPVNSQSTAYVLILSDSGKTILHPAADDNARTFTIPDNGNVAYPVGTALTFINRANTVTIAITTDTLIFSPAGTTGSRTLAANGSATCIKTDSTEWLISGSGLT